ncbi:hypothetical protein Catovirus_1_1101 [Catovirus CTV1]|uniref:C2H2-type domain-containing protein n=1 Tax=Catovirus CTV1 TaxID=1977631 RepID=A0A1V0SBJ8_9VIRU|nr:hypothetical protein Catovirus_1_1101 [Catovirus CTV1]
MKYNCDDCNYSTNDKGNWSKHKKSQKHSKNSNKPDKTTTTDSCLTPKRLLDDSSMTPTTGTIKSIEEDKKEVKKEEIKKVQPLRRPKYICEHCESEYSKSSNLQRHLKSCVAKKHTLLETEFEKYKIEKDNETKIKLLEERLRTVESEKNNLENLMENEKKLLEKHIDDIKNQYENHIHTLKNENKFQKQLIDSAGGIIKKSMNTLTYLLLNHNNAPQLEALADYSTISKNTEFLINDLIHYHRKGSFNKYIGDFIIKQYKKDDPNLQALWSSDIERLNYFIRELINNKEEDLKNDNKTLKIYNKKSDQICWVIDKKGIKVRQFIIDPLLKYIHDIGVKYLTEKSIQMDSLSSGEATRTASNMQEIGSINLGIRNKTLACDINKYIAPYFYLNKDNQN